MAWLAEVLAAAGFLAVSVDHHGNNLADGYLPQGFAFEWERPRDLSFTLDAITAFLEGLEKEAGCGNQDSVAVIVPGLQADSSAAAVSVFNGGRIVVGRTAVAGRKGCRLPASMRPAS
jgi:predicted dienelactone hydrolase